MKNLLMFLMVVTLTEITQMAGANDLIVNSLFKYGPNGATAIPGNTASTPNVNYRYSLVPGLGLQVVPENCGITMGAGFYQDNTMETSIGWKF